MGKPLLKLVDREAYGSDVASKATYSTSTDPPHEVPLLEGLPHEIKREYGTLYISYV